MNDKKPINIPKIPEDAKVPQTKLDFCESVNEEIFSVFVPGNYENKIELRFKGRTIGTLRVEGSKIFFEGDVDKSSKVLLECFKLYAERYLSGKD